MLEDTGVRIFVWGRGCYDAFTTLPLAGGRYMWWCGSRDHGVYAGNPCAVAFRMFFFAFTWDLVDVSPPVTSLWLLPLLVCWHPAEVVVLVSVILHAIGTRCILHCHSLPGTWWMCPLYLFTLFWCCTACFWLVEASGGGRSLGAMTVLAINSMGLPLLARNGAGCWTCEMGCIRGRGTNTVPRGVRAVSDHCLYFSLPGNFAYLGLGGCVLSSLTMVILGVDDHSSENCMGLLVSGAWMISQISGGITGWRPFTFHTVTKLLWSCGSNLRGSRFEWGVLGNSRFCLYYLPLLFAGIRLRKHAFWYIRDSLHSLDRITLLWCLVVIWHWWRQAWACILVNIGWEVRILSPVHLYYYSLLPVRHPFDPGVDSS